MSLSTSKYLPAKRYLSSLQFIHKSCLKIIQLFVEILTVDRSSFPRRHSTWHNSKRCGRAKLSWYFDNSKPMGNRRWELIDWQVDQPWKIGPPTHIPNFSTCKPRKFGSVTTLSDSNNVILVGYEMGIANHDSILKYIIYQNLCRRNWEN